MSSEEKDEKAEEALKPKEKKAKYKDWPHTNIEEPLENDVMLGRGAGTNYHPGNRNYRDMVEKRKVKYNVHCHRIEKPLIAYEVIKEVRGQDPPGRFLKRNKETGLWDDIGDIQARKKVIQALREDGPSIREQRTGSRERGIQKERSLGHVEHRSLQEYLESEGCSQNSVGATGSATETAISTDPSMGRGVKSMNNTTRGDDTKYRKATRSTKIIKKSKTGKRKKEVLEVEDDFESVDHSSHQSSVNSEMPRSCESMGKIDSVDMKKITSFGLDIYGGDNTPLNTKRGDLPSPSVLQPYNQFDLPGGSSVGSMGYQQLRQDPCWGGFCSSHGNESVSSRTTTDEFNDWPFDFEPTPIAENSLPRRDRSQQHEQMPPPPPMTDEIKAPARKRPSYGSMDDQLESLRLNSPPKVETSLKEEDWCLFEEENLTY
jgi:hypothetical protein